MPPLTHEPFAGLTRKRLPGMHMIAAIEGGVPLRDALAAFFFMMMHDQVKHDCLIRRGQLQIETTRQAALDTAANPEGIFFDSFNATTASTGLKLEEWSYLSHDDAFPFYVMADTANEQTQRWICEGVEEPRTIPLGRLVDRPEWSKQYYAASHRRAQESRDYVARLRSEIPDPVE